MTLNELLQKINKADYEALDKVIIDVDHLLLLRNTIKDLKQELELYKEQLSYKTSQYNNLVSKHINTYKTLKEI